MTTRRMAAALGAAAILPGPAVAAGLLASAWQAYDAGPGADLAPKSIAAGDLDGDGDADLALGLWYFGGPGIAVLFTAMATATST